MIRFICVILVFLPFGCTQNADRILEFDLSCDDHEIVLDIKRSIDNNKEFLESHNIIFREVNYNQCGYVMKKKSEFMEIKTALTDIDLLMEIQDFYDLEASN